MRRSTSISSLVLPAHGEFILYAAIEYGSTRGCGQLLYAQASKGKGLAEKKQTGDPSLHTNKLVVVESCGTLLWSENCQGDSTRCVQLVKRLGGKADGLHIQSQRVSDSIRLAKTLK